jgi:hypothetical protein
MPARIGWKWKQIYKMVLMPAAVDLQMAQNTVDVLSLTILKGGSLEATIY